MADSEPGDQDCSICHQPYTSPKILHCGHLLCRHCLLAWLKAEHRATCPLCRCPIMEAVDLISSKSSEDFADGLITDLAMESLVESDQILNQDHPCQVCTGEVAKSLCLTCGDFFCSGCVSGHRRSTVSRHHIVEELSSLTAERLSSCRPLPCPAHSGEVCKVYCPTHRTSLCTVCVSTRHLHCPGMMELGEKVQEDCAALQDLSAILASEQTTVDSAIQEQDQGLQDMEESVAATMADIDANYDVLETALKSSREHLKGLVLTVAGANRESASGNRAELVKRKGKLMAHSRVLKHVQRVTKADVLESMTAAMKAKVEGVRGEAATVRFVDLSVPTVKMDPLMLSRMQEDLWALGQVALQETPSDGPPDAQREVPILRFHKNHGKNVELCEDQQTAKKTTSCDGIVLSQEPMQINMVYEIRIEETDGAYMAGCDAMGVVTESPDTVTLPVDSSQLQSAVVMTEACVTDSGTEVDSSVGDVLCDVEVGDTLGLMLTHTHTLLFYHNGSFHGSVQSQVPRPCFFMVDMRFCWTKVKALPVRTFDDLITRAWNQ